MVNSEGKSLEQRALYIRINQSIIYIDLYVYIKVALIQFQICCNVVGAAPCILDHTFATSCKMALHYDTLLAVVVVVINVLR